MVDYLRAAIRWLLRVEFAPSPFAKQLQRVLTVVRQHRGIRRGDLLKKTGFKAKELAEVLGTLTEQGDAYEQNGGWWAA